MILLTFDKIDRTATQRLELEIDQEILIKDIRKGVDDTMVKADILVGFGPTLDALTEEVLEKFDQLKWIHTLTAGVETLPFEILKKRNIIVTNSSGVHGKPISEQVFGMMLSFSRGLHVNFKNQMNAKWDRKYKMSEIHGKTLCIIGAGSIGREVARKAKAFDMKVIGVKRNITKVDHFDEIIDQKGLDEALKVSDYILVLTPLTPETYHLIGTREFQLMKESAIFLNFARGDVVDEEALICALHERMIGGAGLDVFHEEPLPPDSPLWSMENVLISPHTSGISEQPLSRELELFKQLYFSYQKGDSLANRVDLSRQY